MTYVPSLARCRTLFSAHSEFYKLSPFKVAGESYSLQFRHLLQFFKFNFKSPR